MKIMLLLILVSLLVAAGFLLAYLRAAANGQFDDQYTPAIRILFEEPAKENTGGQERENQQNEEIKSSL